MGYFYAISSLAGRFSVAYSYDGGLCGGAIKDLLMGWLFAVLGIASVIKQIFTNVKQNNGEIIKL